MKMKRTWKKILLGIFTTVIFASIFTFIDMGWNVKEVKAKTYNITYGQLQANDILHPNDILMVDSDDKNLLNIIIYDKDNVGRLSIKEQMTYTLPDLNEGECYYYAGPKSSSGIVIQTAGHNFTNYRDGGWVSDATCTQAEIHKKKCKECESLSGTYNYRSAIGHTYNRYSSSGNTITVKCERYGSVDCTQQVTYQLNAPNGGNSEIEYIRKDDYSAATVTTSPANIPAGAPGEPTVKYRGTKADGTMYNSTTKPSDTGRYEAYITMNDQEVSCSFSIAAGGDTYKFYSNGGSGAMSDQLMLLSDWESGKKTLKKNEFTKIGYSFDGWKSNTEKVYADEGTVDRPDLDSPQTYTLKAQWTPNTYKITFEPNALDVEGVSEEKTVKFDAEGENIPSVELPTKRCSTFLGYFTAAEGGNKVYNADGKPAINKWTTAEDTTLYAQWTVNHNWGYKGDGNQIIATCKNEGCGFEQKLTLSAPNSTYNKSAYSAASIDNEAEFPLSMRTSDIRYEGMSATEEDYPKNSTAPTNAGNYKATVTVTVTEDGTDYTAEQAFIIDKATQSASASTADFTWGDTKSNPSVANVEESATPTYWFNTVNSTTGGKRWDDLDFDVDDAGTYYVYAELAETANYKSGKTSATSFKINGLEIVDGKITATPYSGTYNKEPHSISLTVDDEDTVEYTKTYSTSDGGVYTTVNPTFTNAGHYTVNYKIKRFGYEVASGSETVDIQKKGVEISGVKAKDKVYDGNTTATFDYADVSYEGIISGDSLSVEATGTFDNKNVDVDKTVTISALTLGGASKDNYVLAPEGEQQNSAKANITQREVTLAWDPTSFAYDGNAKKPTATVANLVSGDNCDVTVKLVDVSEAINAGNYKAKAAELTGDDSGNYILPSDTEKSFTINKIDQPTVTVTMEGFGYSADPVPTPSVSDTAKENPGITYYYSLENKKTGGTEWKNVAPKSIEPDTYYMYAVLAETTNYNAYTTEPVQFIVDGSDMTSKVSVSDINANNEVIYTYTGKKEHGIKVNIPEDAKVMYGTTDGNYTLSECPTYKDVNAEGYTIYYKVTRTGYNPVKGSAKVVINKAPLTVTPDSGQTKVYKDVDPTFTYTVSGLLGSDTASVVSGSLERENGEDVTDAGYELSGNNLTADNYTITCTSGVKFMITPRNITEDMVTLVQKKFGHTGNSINVAENGNVKVKYNWIDLPTEDYAISDKTATDIGTYFVTITGKHNYQGSVQKEWRITDAIVPVSIEDPEIEITYGSEPTIPITGFKDKDEVKYGTKEDEIEDPTINLKNAGKYKIWIKVIRDGFEPYEGSVIITIKPKVLDIIWGETSLVYNGKIQAPAATVKAESLLEGDSCEVETSSDKKDVGSGYIATAIELTGENSSNYKLPSPLPTTEFKITPKSLTLKARNVSKYVGSKDPVLTYDAVGICSGDTLSGVSVARDPGESVGSYQIRVSVDPAADNKNYTITMQSGVLVIKNHESNDEGSNGNSDGGSNGGGNSSGNTIPVVPVQKPVVLPIDSLTANAANKNTKNTAGNNKGANLGADGTNAETDELLGTNGAGNLTLHLEVSEHSPIETASIETPVTKLLEGSDVFTTEEALAIKGGVDARVWVHIDKLDMSVVPDSVHDEILSAAKSLEDDNVELLYFDISLFKQIGDGEIVNIHEPGTHIDITLELPESVINTDDKVVREYKILRLHDGVIDVIPTTYNPDTQTISFATDKFSTYVLAYIDKSAEEITEADNTDSITVNEVEKENSSTAIYIILFILLILAIAIIIFILYRRKKNEDTI